ncbi:FtsX-like permease family protein, partial [Bacteroidota bacterium]
ITGVIEDQVHNSHLKFNILASFSSLIEQEAYRNLVTTFYAFVTYNYLKLDKSADLAQVQEKIDGVVEKNMGEGMKESGSHFELYLQPVTDIHLNSDLVHELEPNGSRSSVFIFSAISMLILLIACVNFINLTTARSSSRLKEIGIRQITGAGKGRLFRQFILESVFFSLFSIFLAAILTELARPWFYNFSGINPQALPFSGAEYSLLLLGLGITIGLISGFYPAFHISRLQWLVKGTIRRRPMKKILRNVLVVLQLGITLFLVFNTLLVYKQLQLINTTDIGINKDDLLILPMRSPTMYNQYEFLKNEMISLPSVKQVTASSSFLGNFQQRRGFFVEGFDRNDMWMLHYVNVDPSYLEVMETGIILGRNFRQGSLADSNAVIINASMMKQAGWENPIGKKITKTSGGKEIENIVIGMVDDFNYTSVHSKVESLLIFNNVQNARYLGLRLSGGGGLDEIEEKWTVMYPEYPFDYFFQEDFYDDLYREDQRMGSLFIYFTILAILISVLGLFGLVLFTSSRRNKEIGIRKVMGGEGSRLVFMLLKEYPVLLLIASVFALPASWYFANRWLENFALKTDISLWIYIISVLLVLFICLGTIILQTLRTARSNPVDALRYE